MIISFNKLQKIVKRPIATFWYHRKLEQKASNGPEYQYFLHQIISLKCDVLISSHSITKTLKWSKIWLLISSKLQKNPKISSRNVFISSQIVKNMTISCIKLKQSKHPYATFWYHCKLEQRHSNGPKYEYFLHQIKKFQKSAHHV